jgi:glycosyltransferase involved in cell wall biosynthesis
MEISIIIPMFNEEENVQRTIHEVGKVMEVFDSYEIIVVDDGSRDQTLKIARECESKTKNLRIFSHKNNMGMGKAIKTGFQVAEGDIFITLDADLSYDPIYIPILVKTLSEENLDIVIGSHYMEGGKTEDIPFLRLFVSRMANRIVGYAMKKDITTVTGILRAYNREVIDSIEIESSGTEINPEILSKAIALGFEIKEIPVILKGRKLGKSKVEYRSTTISHLLLTFYERPMILFGVLGLFILLIGIITAIYLFYLYLMGTLDPNRPLMLFMVLMILSGIQILIFGFVATQISLLKKEIYVIQKENKKMQKKLKIKDFEKRFL